MKYTYRNLGGKHSTLEGDVVRKGETFVSDDPDLMVKFPCKFERLGDLTEYDEDKPPKAELPPKRFRTFQEDEIESPEETKDDTVEPEESEEEQTESKEDSDETDVTSEFPLAVENEITVTKDKKGWWLYDEDEFINEKPLRRKDVEKQIEKYLD